MGSRTWNHAWLQFKRNCDTAMCGSSCLKSKQLQGYPETLLQNIEGLGIYSVVENYIACARSWVQSPASGGRESCDGRNCQCVCIIQKTTNNIQDPSQSYWVTSRFFILCEGSWWPYIYSGLQLRPLIVSGWPNGTSSSSWTLGTWSSCTSSTATASPWSFGSSWRLGLKVKIGKSSLGNSLNWEVWGGVRGLDLF